MKDQLTDPILQDSSHRLLPLPEGQWKYYQEWHNVLFAHWRVPLETLCSELPAGLQPDVYDGEGWVSLTAFTLKNMRPHFLPAFPALSDFHEINFRTYVVQDGKPGIYFFSLEASKIASAAMAWATTGLPYYASDIECREEFCLSFNRRKDFFLHAEYRPEEQPYQRDALDVWLTERYTLFHKTGNKVTGNEIHHRQWPLQPVNVRYFNTHYRSGELSIGDRAPDKFHFAKSLQVLTWPKKKYGEDEDPN
jgi:hypothetical protein